MYLLLTGCYYYTLRNAIGNKFASILFGVIGFIPCDKPCNKHLPCFLSIVTRLIYFSLKTSLNNEQKYTLIAQINM
jgi:hypothetical protein